MGKEALHFVCSPFDSILCIYIYIYIYAQDLLVRRMSRMHQTGCISFVTLDPAPSAFRKRESTEQMLNWSQLQGEFPQGAGPSVHHGNSIRPLHLQPALNLKWIVYKKNGISTVDQLVWWNLVLQTQGRAQPVRTAPFLLPAFNVAAGASRSRETNNASQYVNRPHGKFYANIPAQKKILQHLQLAEAMCQLWGYQCRKLLGRMAWQPMR